VLAGDLADIVTLASGNEKPVTAGPDGLHVTLVAGTRNHLNVLLKASREMPAKAGHSCLYKTPGEDESPIGPLMVRAQAQGYSTEPSRNRRPYHGYYYRILKGEAANGGAYDYVASPLDACAPPGGLRGCRLLSRFRSRACFLDSCKKTSTTARWASVRLALIEPAQQVRRDTAESPGFPGLPSPGTSGLLGARQSLQKSTRSCPRRARSPGW
jgi:Protein of unknown function (DUF2950)